MSRIRIIQLSVIIRSVNGIRFNNSTTSHQQCCSHCKKRRISLDDLLCDVDENNISDVTYYNETEGIDLPWDDNHPDSVAVTIQWTHTQKECDVESIGLYITEITVGYTVFEMREMNEGIFDNLLMKRLSYTLHNSWEIEEESTQTHNCVWEQSFEIDLLVRIPQ